MCINFIASIISPVHISPLVIHVNEKSMWSHAMCLLFVIPLSALYEKFTHRESYIQTESRCRRVESMKRKAPPGRNEFFMRTSLYTKLNLKGN